MVDSIRNIEKALGAVSYELSDKMKANREFSRSLFIFSALHKNKRLRTKQNRSMALIISAYVGGF